MTEHSIVPAHLAVKAMRDNGYKNAAHALAELMDNSIQAGAKNVELLCGERTTQLQANTVLRVHQIAVLDDGGGMDTRVLRMALQFGNGTRLTDEAQTGIGRFGMGLPSSSVSQCRRVDVWSWQTGVESAIHTYLDLDEIIEGKMAEVPEPSRRPIPEIWRRAGRSFGSSGTLVVWSQLDRIIWRTARAIVANSEFLIGRTYRRFLVNGDVKIRMVGFNTDPPYSMTTEENWAQPNDPLYLTPLSSLPAPFDSEPMFEPFGEEVGYRVAHKGRDHTVRLRFSIAKKSARDGRNAGARKHGAHAAKNVGVSIVRAGRELEIDTGWVLPSDPRERWWGVEIDFPPALDELFGVTNNKQHAHNFSEMAKADFDDIAEGKETMTQVEERLKAEGDPRGPLISIVHRIEQTIAAMRKLLRAQTAREELDSGRARHDVRSRPEYKATIATRELQKDGEQGASDKQEASQKPQERQAAIEGSLEQYGVDREQAKTLSGEVVSEGLKYTFSVAGLRSSFFFDVEITGGAVLIILNSNHPAYEKLIEVLDKQNDDADAEALQRRLRNASDGLKLLLMAWARYEDQKPDGRPREQAQEARDDWGRIARRFLSSED